MQKKNVKRKVPKIETVSFPLKNIENKKLGNALTFRDFFYYIGRLSKSKKVGLWSLLDTSRQAQKVPKKPVFFGGEACFKVGKRVSGDRSAFDVDLRLCKGTESPAFESLFQVNKVQCHLFASFLCWRLQ